MSRIDLNYDTTTGNMLVGNEICPYCQRTQLALLISSIPFKYKSISFSNKPDWFDKISPLGKIPILVTEDGAIFESDIIIDFIDRKKNFSLSCDDPFERAKLMMWVRMVNHIQDLLRVYFISESEAKYLEVSDDIKRSFDRLLEIEYDFSLAKGKYIWMDIFFQPLIYLTDILNHYGGEQIIFKEQIDIHRNIIRSNQHMNNVFSRSMREKLLKFLTNRNTVFSRRASECLVVD